MREKNKTTMDHIPTQERRRGGNSALLQNEDVLLAVDEVGEAGKRGKKIERL